eukprot:CAMPEP_0177682536 /NCGR_PEP_ID=MMETSP0447-20121125/31309_1 /TAXON_ID=0 /ORGANISM="Stygamoeba regulata, Strain BSH-02190019" /LENGTH=429 /DNA_ID=CAMNT_0019192041 /DNA_START=66 /DNA_END=1355 /DNA_ORIENTATION=+
MIAQRRSLRRRTDSLLHCSVRKGWSLFACVLIGLVLHAGMPSYRCAVHAEPHSPRGEAEAEADVHDTPAHDCSTEQLADDQLDAGQVAVNQESEQQQPQEEAAAEEDPEAVAARIAAADVRLGADYHKHFNVPSYLSAYYKSAEGSVEEGNLLDFFLRQYYRFFDEYADLFSLPNAPKDPDTGVSTLPNTWLDFGSGPSLWHLVAARSRFDHITLCDYAQPNVNYLRRWKSAPPVSHTAETAPSQETREHDWESFFASAILRHEPELFTVSETSDGQDPTELAHREARRRLQHLRTKAVREVLHCDVHQPKPLGPEWDRNRRFELVTSNLCVEAACRTRTEYRRALKNLASLVQNGGTLVLAAVAGESFYRVGEHRFHCLEIDEALVRDALEDVGFQRVHVERLPAPSSGATSDFEELLFVVASPLWIA